MQRSHSFEWVSFDPDIEKTLRVIRAAKKAKIEAMAEQNNQQRTIRDYFKPVVTNNYFGIASQTIIANYFELKLALISMV